VFVVQLGSGVRAVQIREHESGNTDCFFLLRTDGSVEDFSTFKCIKTLFPAFGKSRDAQVRCQPASLP
jgi:hypothetical protein